MLGNMMNEQLLISGVLEHAIKNNANTEIVSNTVEGGIHRYTIKDSAKRSKKLANFFDLFAESLMVYLCMPPSTVLLTISVFALFFIACSKTPEIRSCSFIIFPNIISPFFC